MYRLLVKKHNKTGLMYLCKTEREDWNEYCGSGTYWKKHIKLHGKDITTTLLFETDSKEIFKQKALYYSDLFNVSKNSQWANLVKEQGDGGNTVQGRKWINNGTEEKYTSSLVPEGWKLGRLNNCIFKDKERQKEFSSRVDRKKSGEMIRKAWLEGRVNRDHSKCGKKGELNPAKRLEVRQKIGLSNSKSIVIKGILFKSIKSAAEHFNVKRHIIDKWRKNNE